MKISDIFSAGGRRLISMARASLPVVRRASEMEPRDWLGLTGHIIAAGIAITSTVGIYNFTVGFAGQTLSGRILLVPVALFVGVILQIIIVNAIKLAVRSYRSEPGTAALAVALMLVVWIITVGASYGSFWNFVAKDSYQSRATNRQIASSTLPLEDMGVRFKAATDAFALVATHAGTMATLEDGDGLSCGYSAGTGQGDRYDLRIRQKAESKDLSDQLTSVNQGLRTNLDKIKATSDTALAAGYRDARAARFSPSVTSAINWIDTQIGGFSGGFTANGATFPCNDPKMVGLLKNARESLAKLPNIPAAPPRMVQISDSEGMLMSFVRLLGLAKDELAQDSDFLPVLFPTILELIMTILIVIGEHNRPITSARWQGARREIDPNLQNIENRYAEGRGAVGLHQILSEHIVELNGAPSACFVIPCANGSLRDRARALLVLCSSRRIGRAEEFDILTPYRARLPFQDLPKLATAGWGWRDRYCDVHLLPRHVADEVRRLITHQAEAQLFS